MNVDELLYAMRTGDPQPPERIEAFVRAVVDGSASRPQAAAWLAWAFARTLDDDETLALTRAMTHSGEVLQWGEGSTLIDKHSTGGVGDKVSLVLAPIWAELGLRVPMISGRGLGHTGGTLDKLEAIPGYRTDLHVDELRSTLDQVGCFISGQTAELAPADRTLYALRNEVCAVESIPLIVGSILSKKLAEGVQKLVLDVKTGSGAFMQTEADARALAEALVRVAVGAGVDCSARITAMDRPLGRTIGNALEVIESIEALKGEGPDDLRTVTVELADHPDAASVLDSGAAFERFVAMVRAQGGDVDALHDMSKLEGSGCSVHVIEADRAGHLQNIDARGVGRAAFLLGAGRKHADDAVDFGVGIRLLADGGDEVAAGQPLAEVHHRDGRALDEALGLLGSALEVADEAPTLTPLVRGRVG